MRREDTKQPPKLPKTTIPRQSGSSFTENELDIYQEKVDTGVKHSI